MLSNFLSEFLLRINRLRSIATRFLKILHFCDFDPAFILVCKIYKCPKKMNSAFILFLIKYSFQKCMTCFQQKSCLRLAFGIILNILMFLWYKQSSSQGLVYLKECRYSSTFGFNYYFPFLGAWLAPHKMVN